MRHDIMAVEGGDRTALDYILWLPRTLLQVTFVNQVIMAAGIFPATIISVLMTPKRSPVRFIANIFGIKFRTSSEVFEEKFKAGNEEFISEKYSVDHKKKKNREAKTLETYRFTPKDESDYVKVKGEKQYVIHCPGNSGSCDRFFEELKNYAMHTGSVCITYNYPGIGKSNGLVSSKRDLIASLESQIRNLTDKGIDPVNIHLSGFSIGGATASAVFKKFERKGSSLGSFFGDRTFSDMPSVVAQRFPLIGNLINLPVIKQLLFPVRMVLKYLVVKPTVVLLDWNYTTDKDYRGYEPSKKGVMAVKPRSKASTFKILKYLKSDISIPYSSSLDQAHTKKAKRDFSKNLVGLKKILELYGKEGFNNEDLKAALKLCGYLKNHPVSNAIVYAGLKGIEDRINKSENSGDLQEFFDLVLVGYKMRRLAGVKKGDPHDTHTNKLHTRSIHNTKLTDARTDSEIVNNAKHAIGLATYRTNQPSSQETDSRLLDERTPLIQNKDTGESELTAEEYHEIFFKSVLYNRR